MTNECDNLDAYFDGQLTPGEAARFAAHLDACPACREALDEQHWIDGLLREPAIAQQEMPSAELVATCRGALARRLQFVRILGWTAAAAAVLVAAAGWIVLQYQQTQSKPNGNGTHGLVAKAEPVPAPPQLETNDGLPATFVAGPDVIALPVESAHADVTIVRIFPVYDLDSSAQASLGQPATSGDFDWLDLNGG